MSEDAVADDGAPEDTSAATGDDGPTEPDPTPQSDAFRRQQLFVGTGVSALAGVAVIVAGIQQFPGFPLAVYVLVGMAVTTLLFGLLLTSMFASAAE